MTKYILGCRWTRTNAPTSPCCVSGIAYVAASARVTCAAAIRIYVCLHLSASFRICPPLLLRPSVSVAASFCACLRLFCSDHSIAIGSAGRCPCTSIYQNVNSPIYALNFSFLYHVGLSPTYLCVGLCNTGRCYHPLRTPLCGVEIESTAL